MPDLKSAFTGPALTPACTPANSVDLPVRKLWVTSANPPSHFVVEAPIWISLQLTFTLRMSSGMTKLKLCRPDGHGPEPCAAPGAVPSVGTGWNPSTQSSRCLVVQSVQ